MRAKLRNPSVSRGRRWGKGLGAVGTFVGTVAGSLPIGVTPRKRRGPSPVKLLVPITGGAALVGVLAKRRRARAADTSGFTPSPYSAQPVAASGVEGAGVVTPSATAPPVDPPTPTDVVDTATEQARVEAVEGPGVEGVVEAPRDTGGETTGSTEAGEVRGS